MRNRKSQYYLIILKLLITFYMHQKHQIRNTRNTPFKNSWSHGQYFSIYITHTHWAQIFIIMSKDYLGTVVFKVSVYLADCIKVDMCMTMTWHFLTSHIPHHNIKYGPQLNTLETILNKAFPSRVTFREVLHKNSKFDLLAMCFILYLCKVKKACWVQLRKCHQNLNTQ